MSTDEIEAEAIRIHNQSEATEERIWKELKRHKHYGPYPALKWEDIKEGFYKERTRLLAKKKLEENAPPDRRRPRQVQPVRKKDRNNTK